MSSPACDCSFDQSTFGKMASSEKLSGETLIVRHIPLAHGQSVGCQLYNHVDKPRRPCSLHLSSRNSPPEKEELPKETLDVDFHSYSSKSSSNNESESMDQSSENTKGFDSSPTSHSSPSPKMQRQPGRKGTTKWQNPFLPEVDGNEDEEDDDDDDGDNMHKYCEGSSIRLHGNLNRTQNKALGYTTEPWHPCSSQCIGRSPVYSRKHNTSWLHQDTDLYGSSREHKLIKSLSDSRLQQCRQSKGTPILMDCECEDWGDEESNDDEYVLKERTFKKPNGYKYVQAKSTSDCGSSTQNQTDYISDSSCNSSDGVLVNFSAIYNKTNNAVPATPHDLDSPAKQPQGSQHSSQKDEPLHFWSPSRVDPNCNIYPLDPDGLSSPEISELTSCVQSHAQLMTSTQNYYKLVTCDLSSQSSPSPVWSSVTSCSETHSHGSLTPPTEYFLFKQPEREEGEELLVKQKHLQDGGDTEANTEEKGGKQSSKAATARKTHSTTHHSHEQTGAAQSRSWDGTHSSPTQPALPRIPSCPNKIDTDEPSHVPKLHITSFAELARCKKVDGDSSAVNNSIEVPTFSKFSQNTSILQEKPSPVACASTNIDQSPRKLTDAEVSSETSETVLEGACAPSPEMVRYTKAQRPTFLPIQPFILQPPSGKQHGKGLGSLLTQYISNKHGKSSLSKCKNACKGLGNQFRPSPLGSCSSVYLEAASSSDSCSTCTPSPVHFHHNQPHWPQPSPLLLQNHSRADQNHKSPKSETGQTTSLHLLPITVSSQNSFSDQVPLLETASIQKKGCVSQQELSDHESFPAVTSVTFLTPDSFLTPPSRTRQIFLHPSKAGKWEQADEEPNTTASAKLPCFLVKERQLHSDSCLTDRPPEEFCLSPDASAEFLSMDLLQKRGMLKSVSTAVDLITAHFCCCKDPEEKIILGNGLLCPTISHLVLRQLCPAIRNVLQDGLRAFKLDLIVGQRRNKPWSVVEASIQPGPSPRILHSLVSVVRRCSNLTSHDMRFNAFFLGLLNLRGLESWFCHLHACADVIAQYYHPWSFLALSQGPACKSLFLELLHLLQPLSHLPFDLHLLSELKLQRRQEQGQKPARSLTSDLWTPPNQEQKRCTEMVKPTIEKDAVHLLSQTESLADCSTEITENLKGCGLNIYNQPKRNPRKVEERASTSLIWPKRHWLFGQTSVSEGVTLGVCTDSDSHDRTPEILKENCESSPWSQGDKPTKELRWARLFGSGIGTSVTTEMTQQTTNQTQKTRLPSQWLRLGASKVDLLTQSIWGETGRALGALSTGNSIKTPQ